VCPPDNTVCLIAPQRSPKHLILRGQPSVVLGHGAALCGPFLGWQGADSLELASVAQVAAQRLARTHVRRAHDPCLDM
jgi:hypothetical protein